MLKSSLVHINVFFNKQAMVSAVLEESASFVKSLPFGDHEVFLFSEDCRYSKSLVTEYEIADSICFQMKLSKEGMVSIVYLIIPFKYLIGELHTNFSLANRVKFIEHWESQLSDHSIFIKYMKIEFELFIENKMHNFHNSISLYGVISMWLLNLDKQLRYLTIDFTQPIYKESLITKLELNLSEHINKSIPTIENMANDVNMSPSNFRSKFKNIYRNTPHRHFLLQRLKKSVDLLMNTELSVSQIAYRVGFQNPSGLSKLLRRECGFTPLELRGKLKVDPKSVQSIFSNYGHFMDM